MTALLGQVQIHERGKGADCVADNGFCPGWIADNIDRYTDPLVDHVYLTLVSLAIGFAIAFSLALLAHRRRWLVGPITSIDRTPETQPSASTTGA